MLNNPFQLVHIVGDRGRINTGAGRWCRLRRGEVEIIAGLLVFAALCGVGVVLRVLVVVWGMFG